jgi:hypothetical protein
VPQLSLEVDRQVQNKNQLKKGEKRTIVEERAVRVYRRRDGVAGKCDLRRDQKKPKNTLDRKRFLARYSSSRQYLPSPRSTFRRSSPIRTPDRQSARSIGVGTTRERNDEFARDG